MNRDELQQLSKSELVELCLKLQSKPGRPLKTSRTSSLPPSTDKKARRENSKPGEAKPGHEAHFREPSETPNEIIEHRATRCHRCGQGFEMVAKFRTMV